MSQHGALLMSSSVAAVSMYDPPTLDGVRRVQRQFNKIKQLTRTLAGWLSFVAAVERWSHKRNCSTGLVLGWTTVRGFDPRSHHYGI